MTKEFLDLLHRDFEATRDDRDRLLLAIDLTTAERAGVERRAEELQRLLKRHGVAVELPWMDRRRRPKQP